jgi:hypothetical protein
MNVTLSLPAIGGLIRRRVLLNYRVDPQLMQRDLPALLRPKLLNGEAVAGICLIRLEQIRPTALPKFVGIASENAAHRVAVVWTDDFGVEREGVYIFRRDSSSAVNRLLGGRVFPGVYHAARFDVEDDLDALRIDIQSMDGAVHIHLSARGTDRLPATSAFDSLEAVSRFFEDGADGYSPDTTATRLDGMRLRTSVWKMQPLDVSEHFSSVFADETRFAPGSVSCDSAFVMRNVEHEWLRLPSL